MQRTLAKRCRMRSIGCDHNQADHNHLAKPRSNKGGCSNGLTKRISRVGRGWLANHPDRRSDIVVTDRPHEHKHGRPNDAEGDVEDLYPPRPRLSPIASIALALLLSLGLWLLIAVLLG